MTVPSIVILLGLLLAVLYCLLMIFYIRGWRKLGSFDLNTDLPVTTSITVIIPVRNEEQSIIGCLESLYGQDYPVDRMEVIIADDSSTDSTVQKAREFIERNHLKNYILLGNTGSSKKDAIRKAVEISSGKVIITTDADCRAGKHWLRSLIIYYERFRPRMIAGPVSYYKENNLFEKMQTLEFIGLVATGAAGIANKRPIMCNGANLLYEKEAFNKVNGFEGSDTIASGDDTFLLFKISGEYPGEVHFLKSLKACVYTQAKPTITDFFHQRKRWSSKTRHYTNSDVKAVALIVYLFNAWLVLAVFLLPFREELVKPFLSLFAAKCIVDFIFLYFSTSFFKRKELLYLFLPEQILYLFYILVVGSLAPFGFYKWKGRRLKQ